MRHIILFSLALVAGLGGTAQAQRRFDAQIFHPAPVQRTNPVGLYSAEPLADSAFELGLMFHFDRKPLALRSGSDVHPPLYHIISHQASLHLMGGFGLFDRLEISADIPLIVSQGGDDIPVLPNFDVNAANAGFSFGDARLIGKLLLATSHTPQHPGGAALGLVLEGLFPTGDPDSFQGERWRFSPRLVVDAVSVPGHRFSFNAGYTFRQRTDFAGLTVDNTFDWGFGAHFVNEYVHVVPEIRGSLVHNAADFGPEESPIEAGLTIRVLPIHQLQIQGGVSAGLFQGFGAPLWRVMFGVSWLQSADQDRDGDGYANDEDGCPDEPEDFDEWQDEDGCPDPDNDEDGILDDPDQCPNEPEDRDQFEDSNGCPDPDNDQDGILDDPDQCPNEPEDVDQFEDEDGCPDPDNDQDGILDDPDQCPNEPEDIDGFEDENGCPDPDNDQDGILDDPDRCPNDPEDMNGVEDEDGCPEIDTDGDGLLDPIDQCPREPEDMDGFEDEDGCPDPDNDQDGIPDVRDQCPNEPETVNGNQDEDGCPDEALVEVTCRAIVIHDMVYFRTNRAEIQSRSFDLLNQVAGVMRARPDIRRIRVEGHTDSRASDRYNLDLSTRRAASVREYVLQQGIGAERVESQGFGESRPIAPNTTADGRAANRRVEFVILDQEGCAE